MERNTALKARQLLDEEIIRVNMDIEQYDLFMQQFNNMNSDDIEQWVARQIIFKQSRLVGIGNEMYFINKALEK